VVLRFLVLGALLFAAERAWTQRAHGAREPIVITSDELIALRREATARTGFPPGTAEMDDLVAAAVDEEILFRQAVARGLEDDDAVVRRRLVQNARFVGSAAPEASLYREARALGFDERDTLVRRRLVDRMRALVEVEGEAEPTDAELAAYLAAHGERFALPDRVSLTHVFLSRQRRGADLDSDAHALHERVRAQHLAPAAAAPFGDPLPIAPHLARASHADLAARFGADFAAAVLPLPVGAWSAPLPSAYGLHLVWVEERIAGGLPPLDRVRDTVREAVRRERANQALRRALAAWRTQYDVVVAKR
jgi:hypothetical protein